MTTEQRNRSMIPDAWVHVERKGVHGGILFEVDRGTEDQKIIKDKVLRILNFTVAEEKEGSGHAREFGIPPLAVAFVTTSGASRLELLVQWTEQELTQTRNTAYINMFRFIRVPEVLDAGLDPQEFFCTKRWRKPFTSELFSLLKERATP